MFEPILTALADANVQFVVIGGVAMGLLGYPRSTFDLDIAPGLDRENLERLFGVLEAHGYRPRVPVRLADFADPEKRREWHEQKHMLALNLVTALVNHFELDLAFALSIPFEELHERSRVSEIDGRKIHVACEADMISLKGATNRAKDAFDVSVLRELDKARQGEQG